MKAFKPYLMHILEECEYLESSSKDLKFEDFLKDEKNKISKLKEKIKRIVVEI